MRERIGYSNFVDKYGKIVFPFLILFLYLGFVSPMVFFNGFARDSMLYCFYVFIPNVITIPLNLQNLWKAYAPDKSYNEFLSIYRQYIGTYIALSIFAIVIICCTIAFLVLYFAKHKTNKGLLVSIPSLYIVMTIILCASTKGIPFVGFYTTLIFLILAILYCANAPLLPKPRQHKPTKSERIAELEKQVAELTKEKDTH